MKLRSSAPLALRVGLLGMAFLHTIPARKHLAAFFDEPSITEGWKGFGALIAIGLYLLPVAVHARGFGWLWRNHRRALLGAGWGLALAHAVPASDHLPRLFATPSYGDAWRGLGAALACLWFVAPLRAQAAALSALRRLTLDPQSRIGGAMTKMQVAAIVGLGLLLGGVSGGGLVRAASHHAHLQANANPAAGPTAVVPFAKAPIVIDGELEDEGWAGAVARTGAFPSVTGGTGKPYSDARFTYRDGNLYIVLYAADEDIRTTDAEHDEPLYPADAFRLVFQTGDGERILDVSPRGVVTDGARMANGKVDFSWESRAEVAVDTDGTIDDSTDMDEEWVVEMAIPLASLGLRGVPGERVGVSIRRCDEPKGLGRLCSSWGADPATGSLVLGSRTGYALAVP